MVVTKESINRDLANLFLGKSDAGGAVRSTEQAQLDIRFSYLFFSDVRKNVTNREKYTFARELVEFADQSGFEAVYFPERHFSEFGSIYANSALMAAYFAPITSNVRLRTAATTVTLHHPAEIVENWAMVDILSDGRVDLGFGSGWEKADFILSPDTYADRAVLRNERIPVVQSLWRGDDVTFPGPSGEMFVTRVHPRPIQPELNVWYITTTRRGFEHAGANGYNLFTMLSGIDLNELGNKIEVYRQARKKAGLDPATGTISLMMHTLVHPDIEWVTRAVSEPFRDYIGTCLRPHLKAMGKDPSPEEAEQIVDYSFARYFQTGGLFGSVSDCRKQIDKALSVGVDEIAFLQDFGIDYADVKSCLGYLEQLVNHYRKPSCREQEARP